MKPASAPDPDPRGFDPAATGRRVLEVEAAAIQALVERVGTAFPAAVERLAGCTQRVVTTGMGKSGFIAQKMAATLASTGTPAHYLHPAEAIHGDLGMVTDGDVVVAFSNSGETEEAVRLLELLRRIDVQVIAIVGRPRSTLGEGADLTLDVGIREEACPLGLVPTASTTAALAMADALAVAVYERKGFKAENFAFLHPGGALGRKLIRVGDLMHTGDRVPTVRPDTPLRDALVEMTAKGLGFTCVVEADQRLVGVLTDGDLRRLLGQHANPLDQPAGEGMTRDPKRITTEALAAQALRLLEENKITALCVTDEADRLIGVIHLHDLWRTQLF